MSQPIVSICCIVYNHEKYLRDCIEGFLMQKASFSFEIIIHDDASTDSSPSIIREYCDKYPNLILPILQTENQYSQGKKILPILVQKANGKYIAICEGDDYWTNPLKLQKQVDFLESHPDYSMCFHSAGILLQGVDQSKVGARCESIQEREYSSTELFSQWIVPTASILFRKEVFDKYHIKHREWLTRGDISLVLTCARCGRIWGMNEQMSVYRVQPGSVSHNPYYRDQEVYKLPNHFRAIFENFPEVDARPVKWNISHAYFARMKVQSSFWNKIKDFALFVFWDPRYAFSKIRELLMRKVVS